MDTSVEFAPDNTTQLLENPAGVLQDLIVQIDHIAVAVEDLESAVRWYTGCLGFRLIERRETSGRYTGMISAVVQAGHSIVVLLEGLQPASQVSRFIARRGPGVQHVAFLVTNLDEALQRLRVAGGRADTGIIQDEGIRQVFLHRDGASGVRFELIERRGGTFTDDSVERLFLEFESKDLY